MRWRGPIRQPALARGYEQGQPAARREQDGEEPADRDARQSGTPGNGTKRVRIGKASGSTDRCSGPDAVRLPASPRERKWVP
jgi:hypothetical protein